MSLLNPWALAVTCVACPDFWLVELSELDFYLSVALANIIYTCGSTFENALCIRIASDFFVTGMNFLESLSWNHIKISLTSQIRMLWLKCESMWSQCLSVLKFMGYFSNLISSEQLFLWLSVFTLVNWNLFLSTKLSLDKNI